MFPWGTYHIYTNPEKGRRMKVRSHASVVSSLILYRWSLLNRKALSAASCKIQSHILPSAQIKATNVLSITYPPTCHVPEPPGTPLTFYASSILLSFMAGSSLHNSSTLYAIRWKPFCLQLLLYMDSFITWPCACNSLCVSPKIIQICGIA